MPDEDKRSTDPRNSPVAQCQKTTLWDRRSRCSASKERAALAKNRTKVECGKLSHPTHSKIGEAYLAFLVDSLSEPSGARVKKQGKRDKHEHELFKKLVRKAYSP